MNYKKNAGIKADALMYLLCNYCVDIKIQLTERRIPLHQGKRGVKSPSTAALVIPPA